MPLITWKESFSVGIANIDSQHGRLVELINQLHEGMIKGHANEILGPVLDQLVAYTESHFATEERLMASCRYPGLASHTSQHTALTQSVKKLVADFKSGRVALSMSVFHFLKDWLQNHILESDQKYAAYVRRDKFQHASAG